MKIFERGDYRAFIVIAPSSNIDRALFAFPVFEGERVSDVFAQYRSLYIPDTTTVTFKKNINPDEPTTLGYVFATSKSGEDKFLISTVTPHQALWGPCVSQWEDQWVFDHLMAIGESPRHIKRVFKGGREIQAQVADSYSSYIRQYMLAAVTLFLATIFLTSKTSDDQ